MIHNIHGAPHHSQVKVGDTKRLTTAIWSREGNAIAFYRWFHAQEAVVRSGPANLVISADSNGAPTMDLEFTGVGTVVVDVYSVGTVQPKTLTIEVVA